MPAAPASSPLVCGLALVVRLKKGHQHGPRAVALFLFLGQAVLQPHDLLVAGTHLRFLLVGQRRVSRQPRSSACRWRRTSATVRKRARETIRFCRKVDNNSLLPTT